MSVESSSKNTASAMIRVVLLVAMALFIIGLQIALPYLSYRYAGPYERDGQLIVSPNPDVLWSQHLRFDGLLDPYSLPSDALSLLSCTICKDELIILWQREPDDGRSEFVEIVKVNLRSGRISKSPATKDISYVASDGNTLWLLPDDIDEKKSLKWWPLTVSAGRPVSIQLHYEGRIRWYRLRAFVDGHWRTTDQFAPWPGNSMYTHFKISLLNQGEQIHLLTYSRDDIYYRHGIDFVNEEEARFFTDGYVSKRTRVTDDELREIGWTHIHFDDSGPEHLQNPFADLQRGVWSSGQRPFGHWFENESLYGIRVQADPVLGTIDGFEWCRYRPDGRTESEFVPSPIRWKSESLGDPEINKGLRVVCSPQGDVFIISLNALDGRLHVMRWDNGRLRLVARRGSELMPWVCLDIGLFFSFTFVVPMLLLGIVAWLFQKRGSHQVFSSGHETVVLSGCLRRGIARTIDSSIFSALLILSVVLHPDSIGWWGQVSGHGNDLFDTFNDFIDIRDWYLFHQLQKDALELMSDFVSAPTIGWLLIAAVSVLIAQLIWQARSGKSLGKWLLGIKVVRTTLRPCGLARSLLREILMVLDSLLLFSWVPGVISILVTCHSQRMGDLFADTIVIRDLSVRLPQTKSPSDPVLAGS